MKLHQHFNLKEKEAKEIFGNINNYWNSHSGEKQGQALDYILAKYTGKKLKYALVQIGYAFCLNDFNAEISKALKSNQ